MKVEFVSQYPQLMVNIEKGQIRFSNGKFKTSDEETIRELYLGNGYGKEYKLSKKSFDEALGSKRITFNKITGGIEPKYDKKLVKDVSIIIGTHYNPENLKNCLESLYKNTPDGFELIVVDNDAPKETKDFLEKFKKIHPLHVIHNKKNESFAHFNNQGVEISTKKYILYLNDDIILKPEWLESMVYLLKNVKNCGMVGKMSLDKEGNPFQHKESFNSGKNSVAFAYCVLIEKKFANFDERYIVGGWEDLDLCETIKQKGLDIWIERRHPIIHLGSASINKLPDKMKLYEINKQSFELKWKK